MRKSIFLTMTVMLFAGIANLYGEGAKDKCSNTQNKHRIGVPHTYKVEVENANGYTGNGIYTWYVTNKVTDLLDRETEADGGTKGFYPNDPNKNKFFTITEGGEFSMYNLISGTETKNQLKLTWNAEALSAAPYYLVVRYKEGDCYIGEKAIANIKVMKISPINTFKLNVSPATETGNVLDAANAKVCNASVNSATIVGEKVKYTYGKTTLYYRIKAEGFTGSWKPTITLPALEGATATDTEGIKRTYESVEWKQLDGTDTYKTFTVGDIAAGGKIIATDNAAVDVNKTEDQNSILVKVVINNGTYEGLAEEALAMKARGNMLNQAGAVIDDVKDVDDNCNEIAEGGERKGQQVILPRPTIKQANAGEFIIQIK